MASSSGLVVGYDLDDLVVCTGTENVHQDRLSHPSPSPWSKLNFRILNRNRCSADVQDSEKKSLRDSCLPRCVSVDQTYEGSGSDDTEKGTTGISSSEYTGS